MAKGAPLYTWRSAVTESNLPAGAKLIALTLSLYLTEKQTVAWPSQKTLAHDSGMGERSVRRHLALLEERGYLRREKRIEKGKRRQTDLLHPCTPPSSDVEREGDAAKLAGTMRPNLPGYAATVAGEVSSEVGEVSDETSVDDVERQARRIGRAGARDLLYELFDQELGPVSNDGERGRRNKALREIRQSLAADRSWQGPHDKDPPAAAAWELGGRIRRYRQLFPNVACTERAVAVNWRLLGAPHRNGSPPAPPCEECSVGGGLHAADCSRVGPAMTLREGVKP